MSLFLNLIYAHKFVEDSPTYFYHNSDMEFHKPQLWIQYDFFFIIY